MLETVRLVYHSVSSFGLSLLLTSVASASVVTAESKQCAALFKPPEQGTAMSPSMGASTVMKDTGFVDSSGRPIMRETPSDQSPNGSHSWFPIASQIDVFSPKQVAEALGSHSEIPKNLERTYERMLEVGPQRFVIRPNSLDALDLLYKTMPNFKPVLDHLKRSIAISMASGVALHFSPIILLGNPGVGKTHFAEELATTLQLGYEFISMNSMTAGWVLSGASAQWKEARMGKVAKFLVERDSANPIFLVDEVDKPSGSSQYDPLGPLYQLWETRTARVFVDEFLEVPIDASRINWIATANDITSVPEPIRKRAIVFNIPAPSDAQMRSVVTSLMTAWLEQHPSLPFSAKISEEVLQPLKSRSPRDIRILHEVAIGNALLNGRKELAVEDLDLSVLEAEAPKRKIGFY